MMPSRRATGGFLALALVLVNCTPDAPPASSAGSVTDAEKAKNDGRAPGASGEGQGPAGETPKNEGGGAGEKEDVTVLSATTIVNEIASAIDGVEGATTVTLRTPRTPGDPPFAVGQSLLLHQTAGEDAGKWEEVTIAGLQGTTATLAKPLAHTYTTSAGTCGSAWTARPTAGPSCAQAVVIAEYVNLTIAPGGAVTAPEWNGSTGGILAIRAKSAVTVRGGGVVRMAGKGYPGGASSAQLSSGVHFPKQPGSSYHQLQAARTSCSWAPCPIEPWTYLGGGAGGTSPRSGRAGTGGGGGGHATPGEGGALDAGYHGDVTGTGGLTYGDDALTTIFFGAGGGAGGFSSDPSLAHGGAGGGIVMVFARTISLETAGAIDVSGRAGTPEPGHGGGGGGAGGSALLATETGEVGALTERVALEGGVGGEGVYSGGAGGRGRVAVVRR